MSRPFVTPALKRGTLTLCLGGAGGFAFFMLNLPLPWILGSLAASTLATQVSNFEPKLPASWRSYAMAAIGTMLGTGFTPDVLRQSGSWAVSLLTMTILSTLFFFIAYAAFRRWSDMNRGTAFFSAMPGGLSVVSLLAEDYDVQVNRVVLCHSARIIVLLVSAPIVIKLISGIDLADANQALFHGAEEFDLLKQGLLAGAAILSWALAKRVGFPSAMLLIPLVTSAVLHATGLVTVHVSPVFSILAQIIIGSSVGARFLGYTFRQILRDGWLAALVGGVLAIGSLVGAMLITPFTQAETPALFLSYLPGGAPELGIVALALMIDPAMVAAHHVVRVFLIVGALPVFARRLRDTKS
ncbi:AbrB family transcriptional regulator [Celeribacter sp.]|uniref:AbrB family transcriptional regulator n=1 Tax=Celeribacter sp. TaxID=1890673 RepID=UPI003A95D19B